MWLGGGAAPGLPCRSSPAAWAASRPCRPHSPFLSCACLQNDHPLQRSVKRPLNPPHQRKTPGLDLVMSRVLGKSSTSPVAALIRMMLPVAIASAFLNNVRGGSGGGGR